MRKRSPPLTGDAFRARENAISRRITTHFATESVERFVATYVKADGMRTLMGPAQGRNTYATAKEAQDWINAVTANNAADTVRQIWGDNPRFEVRPCPCWPGHFDPKTVWFD